MTSNSVIQCSPIRNLFITDVPIGNCLGWVWMTSSRGSQCSPTEMEVILGPTVLG